MREFSTTITEALIEGLTPFKNLRDSSTFKDMYNIVPYNSGARPYTPVVNMVDIPGAVFPFPQWFEFEKVDIGVSQDNVYIFDRDYTPFDNALLVIEESDWLFDSFSFTFRGVDYGDNWMLLSPEGTIYKYKGVVYSSEELKASSILKHKGRTVIGGSPNGLWTDSWKRFLLEYGKKSNFDTSQYTFNLGKNFILWSSYDSIDFPYSLLHPEEVLDTLIDESFFMELIYKNEFGYMEMPFSGEVLELIEFRDSLIVFGSNGFCVLNLNLEITGASYTISEFNHIGLKSRGAVGGDKYSLVFISNKDELWRLNSQGLTKLGFQKYMTLLSDDVVITKDKGEDIFYIGDDTYSYVLNEGKLCRVYQTVSKVSEDFDVKAGVSLDTGDERAILETEKIDIGIPAFKTLTGLTVALDDYVKATAQATGEVGSKSIKSKVVELNRVGYGATRVFGKNHTIKIIFDTYKDLDIDVIELKWQIDDSRYRRGIYATQDTTGTGE